MSDILRVRILGCGSSGGVPRLGGPDGAGDWGACDPTEPKNRRTRCSALFSRISAHNEAAPTRVLVDTSPDMRQQLLDARVDRLDAVLITHDHADQTHGLDDLRALALINRARVPVYIDPETAAEVPARFGYCFNQRPGSPYPAILERRMMPPAGAPFCVDGPAGAIPVTPFVQRHGGVDSLGFRCGDIAYSSDVVGLPEESFAVLDGVKLWIVDALQYEPHGTHAHLALALEWIARVRPERAVLTNMHVHLDYETVRRTVPDGVEPAYDGMEIDVPI